MIPNRILKLSGLLLLTASLGACGIGDRLANVGQAPTLSPVEDPTAAKGYKPVQMPMPEVSHASYAPNSLWRMTVTNRCPRAFASPSAVCVARSA